MPISLTPAEVGNKLTPGTALIEYSFAKDKALAFVITRNTAVERCWKFDYEGVRSEVQSARRGFSRAAVSGTLSKLLESPSAALLKPLLSDLPANISRVIIVPADYLEYLPFQTL